VSSALTIVAWASSNTARKATKIVFFMIRARNSLFIFSLPSYTSL
jgi:hypothetical protein